MASLRITLLGGFEARLATGEAVALAGRKSQALLAYLALIPGEACPRDKLIGLLWSDRGESQARGSLRKALTEVRKALSDADPALLKADRDDVTLDAGSVEVDAVELGRLVDDGAPEALERATELFRGDLLDGIGVHDPAFEDWLHSERERLHDRAREAFSGLLDHQIGMGSTVPAITTARRLLALDPLQESTHRSLMKLYANQGDRAMALRQYQACRDVLRAELGLKLDAETERLVDEIRQGVSETDEADKPASSPAAATEPLALPDKPSIAVLPFVNISGDPEQEYFTDGITEDIITELSRFRSLFVIARNSAFSFKGQWIEVKDIGRKLGVRYVVEGSVRRAGNRVRVTAQLVDAVADAHLWAEHYDRDLDDIFAVQDEVTNAIVTAIEPTLGSVERDRARRKPTESLDTWESYQRGLWNVYRYAAQENTEAQSFFRRAIELDPNFAPAHAGLAYAICVSVVLGFGVDPAAALGEARDAAERAVMLDGDDALGHVAVGRVHSLLGEYEAGIFACKTALALNPNLATAHFGLGIALTYSGRYEEGIVEIDEAIRLSPRDPMLWAFLLIKAEAYLAVERYKESLEFARASQRQPNATFWAYVSEAVALAQLDRIEEARQALERVRVIKPDFDMNFVISDSKRMPFAGGKLYIDGLKKAGLENWASRTGVPTASNC